MSHALGQALELKWYLKKNWDLTSAFLEFTGFITKWK